MARWVAVHIVKGSRRPARCRDCHAAIVWGTLARRGAKSIPLVHMPVVLRDESNEAGVTVEVFGFDQLHRCTKRVRDARVPSTPAVERRPAPSSGDAPRPAFSLFTTDRMQQLRAAIKSPVTKERPDAHT